LSNNNNISQFDNLFKEGLSGHSVSAPAGAFQGISNGLTTGVAANTGVAFGLKWVAGVLAAVTIATTAYFALKTSPQDNANAVFSENNNELSVKIKNETNLESDNLDNTSFESGSINISSEASGSFKNTIDKNGSVVIDDNKTIDTRNFDDKKLAETSIKTAVAEADLPTSAVVDRFNINRSIINITGSICPNSRAMLHIHPANETVVWYVNDEKVASNTHNCSYIFNQKGLYKISCYMNKNKVADTVIEVGLATAVVNYIDLGSGMTEAKAEIIGVKSLVWMSSGQPVSDINGFVYNANHFKNEPYLITTDYRGCKDTFYKNVDKSNSSPYFYLGKENTITPNGDGLNDVYEFEIEGQTFFSMAVYDKNDQIVYSTNDPKAYWNGIDARTQKVAENGVYNIVFTYKMVGENDNNFKYVRINLLK